MLQLTAKGTLKEGENKMDKTISLISNINIQPYKDYSNDFSITFSYGNGFIGEISMRLGENGFELYDFFEFEMFDIIPFDTLDFKKELMLKVAKNLHSDNPAITFKDL